MKFAHRIRVIWDMSGKEFFTVTEHMYTSIPSIHEKVMVVEREVREHQTLARREATICDPSPIRMEYYRIRENGEAILSATPMYIMRIFGKALTRGS